MVLKKKILFVALASSILGGCFLDDDAAPVVNTDVVLITADSRLVGFDRANPSQVLKNIPLSGFANPSVEKVVGMDHRPRNNRVYVLTKEDVSNIGRLYILDDSNGVLTLIGSGLGTLLQGSSFGVDFNAQVDGLRVVSDTGQNLVVNPSSGIVTAAPPTTNLNGSSTRGDASAYTNSFDGTLNVRMFNLDTARNKLVRQGGDTRAFNGGVTQDVASLLNLAPMTSIAPAASFDIDGFNNLGYAIMTVAGATRFYEINIPFDSEGTESPVAAIPEIPATPNPLAAVELGTLNVGSTVVGMTLIPRGPSPAPVIVGLNGDPSGMGTQSLVSVPARTPNVAPVTSNISGLQAGERVLSIDFRPFDRKIYALTSLANVYTIDRTTGVATLAVSIANPVRDAIRTGVATKAYSIDFNTTVAASSTFDALRIYGATDTGAMTNNYRILGDRLNSTNAMAGVAAQDPDVRFEPAETPAVDFGLYGIAYANSATRPARPMGAAARVIPTPRLIAADATGNRLLELFSLTADANATPPVTAGNYSGLKNLRSPLNATAFNDLSGVDIFGGDNGLRYLLARESNAGPYFVFNLNITQNSMSPVFTNTAVQFGSGTSATSALFDMTIAN